MIVMVMMTMAKNKIIISIYSFSCKNVKYLTSFSFVFNIILDAIFSFSSVFNFYFVKFISLAPLFHHVNLHSTGNCYTEIILNHYIMMLNFCVQLTVFAILLKLCFSKIILVFIFITLFLPFHSKIQLSINRIINFIRWMAKKKFFARSITNRK